MKKIFLLTIFSAITGTTMISCKDEAETICMDKVWYRDSDGDGKGDPIYYLYSCKAQPEGFVANADDKDDTDPNG